MIVENGIDHTFSGFGGVPPRPRLPVRPDPRENYRIFVNVVTPDRDPSGKFDALKKAGVKMRGCLEPKFRADYP